MRIKTLLILFAIIFSLTAKSQNIVTLSEDKNQITCQVTIYGVKEKKAMSAAEEALRYALFFRGIPDSQYCKNALVGTDENFAAKHPEYFKEMFDKDRFSTFITQSEFLEWIKKGKVSVISFTVNIKALRLDLESQGVKRRFGL